MSLVSPDRLILTEHVDEDRVAEIEKDLLTDGRWTFPILVHAEGRFVMDGHHRVTVARRLRLAALPAILVGYDLVDVEAWRDGEIITPELVAAMARSGGRFPSKTTRHRPKFVLPRCDIRLARLSAPRGRPEWSRPTRRTA